MSTENKHEELNLVCPHCGNKKRFYQKMYYFGMWEFQVNNHGECDDTCDNSDMYQGSKYKLKNAYYFCSRCHNKVAKIPEDKRY